jgi:hypothetical protein
MNASARSFTFDAGEEDENSHQDDTATLSLYASRWSKAYWDCLEENPLVTKSITCAIVSALGALLGNNGLLSAASQQNQNQTNSSTTKQQQGKTPPKDKSNLLLHKISEVVAFAFYGGLVGGPLAHYWNQWLTSHHHHHRHTSTVSSASWSLLIDQLIAQPPMLFLMHLVLDMTGAAVKELPLALHRSWERTGPSLVTSWRFWPVAVYVM